MDSLPSKEQVDGIDWLKATAQYGSRKADKAGATALLGEIERLAGECANWKQLHDADEACIADLHRQLREAKAARAAHEPAAEPVGFVARSKVDGTIFRDFAKPGECHPINDHCEWMPVYSRPTPPPALDPIEASARARYIELHGLPAHDPWELAPSATKEQYREWARNNTPTKEGEHVQEG